MKQPTFAIAVTFQVKPEHADKFLKRILQQASDSVRLEQGCLQFDVLVDEQDPNTVFLYETYLDAAAFETHCATDHFADYSQAVAELFESKSVRRLIPQETSS